MSISMIRPFAAVVLLLAVAPARADFQSNLYTAGHGDIGVGYENGNLFLHYHFASNAVINGSPLGTDVEIDPGDATTVVPASWRAGSQSSPFSRPAGSEWDFLGNSAGQSVWFLPQSGVAGLPFLGIATEELDPSDWSGPITWSVTGLTYTGEGNGQFSIWQQGLGGPSVFAASSNGLPDSWTQGAGLHDHYFYGFTALGTYDVTFRVSGTHVTDGAKADTGTFRFQVGPNVVPEPASVLMLTVGVGAVALVGVRRRRAADSRN